MTTFTKRDSKFWEDHYNEKGRSNDEGEMNARRSVQLSEFSYMFKDINHALKLENNDIVADVGCAGGGMSVLFSSLVKKVFAYDIAKENIAYCKRTHAADNIEFMHGYIERANNTEINKMLLGAVFQYLSKEQLENFADSICSEVQFPNLEKVFISHIPDLHKQYDWLDGYKNFISDKKELEEIRFNWKNYNTWYEPEDLKKYFEKEFDVVLSEVNKHVVQHKYCFDMLLIRKK
jgi:cyclopropane fatty-acyl-phospholipid synthase-like methyltransferase